MPLELADAKSMARARLRGKNAKPRDVDRMARKLIEESYKTQKGGSYEYATASGQAMQHKGRGGGDSVEYQSGGGGLNRYIDRVLEMGGLNAPQGGSEVQPRTRPATDEEIATVTTPEKGPIPPPREPETTTGPTEEGSGLGLTEILAGAGGVAALMALYKYARRKGKPVESLTPDEVAEAGATETTREQPGEIYADEDYARQPLTGAEETIDDQVREEPVAPEAANENTDEGSSFNPEADANNKAYQTAVQQAAEFQSPKDALDHLRRKGFDGDALAQAVSDLADVKTGKGFDFRISRPKIKF